MILCTAVVYILAHCSLSSAKLLPQKKGRKQRKMAFEEDEGQAWPSEPRWVHKKLAAGEPQEGGKACGNGKATMPKSFMELDGVTDSRFEGVIVCYKPEDGYGFIQCPELYKRFGRDVFLHRLQVGDFQVGAAVSFGVFLNKQGLPQAKELEALAPAPTAEPAVAPVAPAGGTGRQPLNPRAEPFTAAASIAPAALRLNPNAKEFPVVVVDTKVLASAPAVRNLSGLWAGDRGATYEVHFYIDPCEGEPVGTVLRCRPTGSPKSFPLHWDATHSCLQLSDNFVLDMAALAENPDTVAWWRGKSRFIWKRVQPGSGHYNREQEDVYFKEEEWTGKYYDNQQWEQSWVGYTQAWDATDEWNQLAWTEGQKPDGMRRQQPRVRAGQQQPQGAKHWVRKEQAQ